MKLLAGRNKDDCVQTSLAMVLDMNYEEVAKLFPRSTESVPGSTRPRGISDAELILALHRLGYSACMVQPRTRDPRGVVVDISQELEDYMLGKKCLITVVQPSGTRHMVAWNGHLVFDPCKPLPRPFYDYNYDGVYLINKIATF